jgi:predicted kinase
MARVVRDGYDAERREAVKAIQLELAGKALKLGVNVVWDAGLWSRAERDAARQVAADAGAQAKLHFLDVPMHELQRRLAERNAVCESMIAAVGLASRPSRSRTATYSS